MLMFIRMGGAVYLLLGCIEAGNAIGLWDMSPTSSRTSAIMAFYIAIDCLTGGVRKMAGV